MMNPGSAMMTRIGALVAPRVPKSAVSFFAVSAVLGLPIFAFSVYRSLMSEPTWLLLAAANLVASFFPVRLPYLKQKSQSVIMTASDIFVFTAILLFSAEVAVTIAAIDCLLGSFKKAQVARMFLNISQISIVTFVVAHLFYGWVGQTPPLSVSVEDNLYSVFIKLFFCAALYFVGNTAAVSRAISLTTKDSFLSIWKESFLWSSLTSLTGVAVALGVFMNFERAQFLAISVALPVILVMIYAYKMNHDRIEMLQEKLTLANYDSLTGLPNRDRFQEQLEEDLEAARAAGGSLALLLLDLDRFKNINDSLGHASGDKLLREVARQLVTCVRTSDTVARLGGDEFTIIVPAHGEYRPADPTVLADRILECLRKPFSVDGKEVFITTSIGISVFPTDGSDPETLFKNADMAMYEAKKVGNRHKLYNTEMSVQVLERISLESQLRRAVEQDDFTIHYQPQVDLINGRITGVEALARWRHAERGWISPGVFIPLAEETGLIWDLGASILRLACTQAEKWVDSGFDDFSIAVNLSAHQLKRPGMTAIVEEILAEAGLPPGCLELELTEGTIMENTELTSGVLNQFKDLGVRVAIDDFGTGYSSLSYLKRFRIDKLKIDRSFVRDIPSSTNDSEIVAAIIVMGHNLNLRITAEGVETNEQLRFLRNHGCDEMQGFRFSRPIPADEITEMLVRMKAREQDVVQMRRRFRQVPRTIPDARPA